MPDKPISHSRFANSLNARILALIIAVALALFGFLKFRDDMGRPLAKIGPGGVGQILAPHASREAVDDCIRVRSQEIDMLAEQGMVSKQDAEASKNRAVTMCSEQN